MKLEAGTEQFALVIPGEPVPKERPRLGRRGSYTPAATRSAEDAVGWQLRAGGVRPLRGDLVVSLRFFSASSQRPDIDNLVKLVLDGCNLIGWQDDSQVVELHAVLERDHALPRTELHVWCR